MPKQKSIPVRILGFIGGSGIYNLEALKNIKEVSVSTPFGKPSDKIILGTLEGSPVAFLPRHGRGHRFLPSEVNYKANIFALKKLGVTHIVSISAVGSLQEKLTPGSLIIPNQILDFTKGKRESTFFGNGVVGHVGFAHPFCEHMRIFVKQVCQNLQLNFHFNGTLVCIEGPRFSSKAESHNFRKIGGDIVGMTAMPEAILAREAEIPYVNVSFVTDFDCWREGEESVNVEMVIATLHKNAHIAKTLTAQIAKEFSQSPAIGLVENEIFSAAQNSIMTAPHLIPAKTKKNLQFLYGKYWKSPASSRTSKKK